jgi:hypothetical protein
MKCIMTFLAGNDAALVSEMIDHHSLQGVDAFVIADSGASVDVSKTLEHYSARGIVYLHVDSSPKTDEMDTVEILASKSFSGYGADCVLIARAGDFWLAGDRSQTLRQVLEHTQPSDRNSLVPVLSVESGLSNTEFVGCIRWNTTASVFAESATTDNTFEATSIEVLRKPSAREPEADLIRILRQVSDARFQRFVDLANEVESVRAELQRMHVRKVIRVADRVSESVKNARERQQTLVAQVSTVARTALSQVHAEKVRRKALRPNTIRIREVDRLLKHGLPPAIKSGTPGAAPLPVVMCLWNRPQRIDTMLESLARQATNHHLRVILWNNAPQDAGYYREHVRAFHRHGALDSIELLSNPVNIGGMARFVVARALWEQGLRGPFIMVDDDQDLDETFVEDSLAGYAAHTINAWWAFRNHGSHWSRSALEPGETADYGGTGGAAVDLAIVEDRAFFDIPVRYFMLEDQWMSHYAHAHGWTIRKSSAQITAVLEETNQYHALRKLKDEFFTFLHS